MPTLTFYTEGADPKPTFAHVMQQIYDNPNTDTLEYTYAENLNHCHSLTCHIEQDKKLIILTEINIHEFDDGFGFTCITKQPDAKLVYDLETHRIIEDCFLDDKYDDSAEGMASGHLMSLFNEDIAILSA